MNKNAFLVSALILTSSVHAAAQQTTAPTISQAPMTTESGLSGNAGDPPSDLPAPESRSWVNKPLLITGASLLVAGYVPALVISQTSDRPSDQDNLIIPVAGPWMSLMDRGCDDRECENEDRNKGLLIADGIVQGVGALGVVLSLLLPGKTTQNWYLIGDTQVVPMRVSGRSYGLGAVGTF
jgi:hypothetical protein